MSTQYTSDKTALWLQRNCGDALEFLGCYDVNDLVINEGDYTVRKKRTSKGVFSNIGYRQASPDFAGTVSFRFFRDVVDLLANLPCPYNLYVYYSNCGADDDQNNYDFIDLLSSVLNGTRTQASVVRQIAPDGETDTGGDITVEMPAQFLNYDVIKPLSPTKYIVSAISTHVINDVAICDQNPICSDECESPTDGCQTIWLVTDGLAGSASVASAIYKSTDGGATWASVSNPFTDTDDNVTVVECDGDTVIVVNGTTASYAYSTDGSTLTEVTTPTKIISSVFILSPTKIWMAAADGYVYFSNNQGLSISTQDAGVATTQALNSIDGASSLLLYAVGAANAFIYTEDGETWQAGTGPAPATVLNVVAAVPGTNILFVGDASGNLYRSSDKGANWSTVYATNTTTSGGIKSISICDCNVILFTANDGTGAGVAYRSKDGGNSWESVTVDTNTGINDSECCGINDYWVVGDDGFIEKLSGLSFRDVEGAS